MKFTKGLMVVIVAVGWICNVFAVEKTIELQLRPIETTNPRMRNYNSVRFSKNQGEMPFLTKGGKLRFKLINNKVVPDRNMDGVVDDQDLPGLELYEIFRIPVNLGEKNIEYPISLNRFNTTRTPYAGLNGHLYLITDSDKYKLELHDSNVNGKFGEIGKDQIIVNDSSPARINKQICIESKLYDFKINGNGESITLTPYRGKVAYLKVLTKNSKDKINQLQLVNSKTKETFLIGGTSSSPFLSPTRSPKPSTQSRQLLIPGKYSFRAVRLQFELKDKKTAQIYGSSRTGKPEFNIKAGENTIKLGPPFKLQYTAIRKGARQIQINTAELVDVAGITYRPTMYAQGLRSSVKAYAKNGNQETEFYTLKYG